MAVASVRRQKAIALLLMLLIDEEKDEEDRKERRKRTLWSREWLLRRQEEGLYNNLLKEFALEDTQSYRSWLRMDECVFHELLNIIKNDIKKQDTVMREAISPGERLAVTLRFLATGETFSSLSTTFRISRQQVSIIVMETANAINRCMKTWINTPSSECEWMAIATRFNELCHFPTIGAIDGKHVIIQPPPNSSSNYLNYVGSHSIVIMAIVDADLNFLHVDIGTNGRAIDGSIWKKTKLHDLFTTNELNVPPPYEKGNETLNYCLVGDDTFEIKPWLLKPYPLTNINYEKIKFNNRLFKAQRCVENAFGILANRWHVFRQPINLIPEKVEVLAMAACILHNFLRSKIDSRFIYSPPELVDSEDATTGHVIRGLWRNESDQGFVSLQNDGYDDSRPSIEAENVRDNFCRYFNSAEGTVRWQHNKLKDNHLL